MLFRCLYESYIQYVEFLHMLNLPLFLDERASTLAGGRTLRGRPWRRLLPEKAKKSSRGWVKVEGRGEMDGGGGG